MHRTRALLTNGAYLGTVYSNGMLTSATRHSCCYYVSDDNKCYMPATRFHLIGLVSISWGVLFPPFHLTVLSFIWVLLIRGLEWLTGPSDWRICFRLQRVLLLQVTYKRYYLFLRLQASGRNPVFMVAWPSKNVRKTDEGIPEKVHWMEFDLFSALICGNSDREASLSWFVSQQCIQINYLR